jgi:predicted nucleic acid-binding protein
MIIIDTGFWLALADSKDSFNRQAKLALQQFNEPLITTWCVITETCHLLLTRKGITSQIAFINSLNNGAFQVFNLEVHHGQRLSELMTKYKDLPMDLADASLVILAEHLGHGRIFSVDRRNFNTYRWKNTQPFENLLLQFE